MSAVYGKVAKVGVVWSLVGRGLYEVIQIPASMVAARLLTPQEFGVVAAANFFVQIAQRLTNFGFNAALVQRKDLTQAHTSTVFYANLILGSGIWAILAIASPWLGTVFRSREVSLDLPVAGLTFLVGSIGSVSAALITRDLRFRATALIDALYAWLMAAIAVWMAWRGWGFWSLIWSQIIAGAAQAVVRLFVANWWPSWVFSWSSLRELLSFGIGLHFKRLLDSAALNVDNLVVGRILGLSPLGYYDKAFTLMNRAVLLLGSAGPTISFRIFAILHGEDARFTLAYRKVLLAATFVSYPAMTLLIGVAPELFFLMFGPQWNMAVVPFQVLAVAGMLKTLNTFVSSAAQSVGQVWGEVRRQLYYLAMIVIGAGVGSLWGLTGASIGVLMASCVMTVLMQHLLKSVTPLSWRDLLEPQLPAVLCSAGLWVALLAIRIALPAESPMTTMYALQRLTLGSFVYLFFVVAFLRFSPFGDLRAVVEETVTDLLPGLAPLFGYGRRAVAKSPLQGPDGSPTSVSPD